MNKINFDFEEHKNRKECVHCKTQEEAEQWCQYMRDNGLKWCNGGSYLEYNNWDTYKEDTCYYFNRGQNGNIQYAVTIDYTIIEFSSLINNKLVKL